MINKKDMSETEIRTKFITPAIKKSGWIDDQIREEYFTDGTIRVVGKKTRRDAGKKADYVLYYKYPSIQLAVVEAKNNNHSVGAGIQQALGYAETLDILFVYSSNGDGFIEHDKTTGQEREISIENFPTPEELWARYKKFKNISVDDVKTIITPYYFENNETAKNPRYYQIIAINRTVEAVTKGAKRILLVMATGTGKTYTAFQIIHRLWKAKTKKRILFLADRNILVDQTMTNDFKSFGGAMIKINRKNLETYGKSAEIYLGLYQSMTGDRDEEVGEDQTEIFKTFSPDFFDLIVIDECHRGSAKDDSNWRAILNYFTNATQIGMTATPKETDTISNIDYFGEAIYTYSLKQGIEDGFLAPYKVMRYFLDKDMTGYIPEQNKIDKYGKLVPNELFEQSSFDRKITLEQRTKLVAKTITEYLKSSGDRFAKTIIFCVDIDHAERMRHELINLNRDLVAENDKYIMQITGDNKEGKAQLDNFIDPNEKYPVIATTSKLLTTGVDAKTCKLIVLESNINSMIEFKQIIGRGTRVHEEAGKMFFTIMDFRNVAIKFFDPEFDGEIIQDPDFVPTEEKNGDENSGQGDDEEENTPTTEKLKTKREKYYIDDVEVTLMGEQVQYLGKDGKLTTKSYVDFTKECLGKRFETFEEFLSDWNRPILKKEIIKELKAIGIYFEDLREQVVDKQKNKIGQDMDEFDLICYLAFNKPAMTKKERVKKLKATNYFDEYSDISKQVLEKLLEKYITNGIVEIENVKVLTLEDFKKIETPKTILSHFGCQNREDFSRLIIGLEAQLYLHQSQ